MTRTAQTGRAYYDEKYAHRSFDIRLPGDTLKDRIIGNMLKRSASGNKKILDAGCGMGHTTYRLPDTVSVIGMDFSRKALQVAAGKSSDSAFVCGDVQNMPFPGETFDYVLAKDILEHVPDDKSTLSEMVRVSKKGATLVMYLPCDFAGFNASFEAVVKKLTGYTIDPEVGHLRRYKPAQMKTRLAEQGLRTVKMEYFVHFSLGAVAIMGVLASRRLAKGGQPGMKGVSGFCLHTALKAFELLGRIESIAMKNIPGAGFFLVAEKA